MEPKETLRIEAFSDGVFAIAITLLILDLKFPKPQDLANAGLSLRAALLWQWPSFMAFTTSFLTILIMWMNHHKVFNLINRSNPMFLILNGLLLFFVTFTPYPTSLVAAYLRSPDEKTAVALYSGTFFCIAIVYNALLRYATWHRRLLSPSADSRKVAAIHFQYLFGPVFYGVAFLASWWHAGLSLLICTALAVFFALPEKVKSDA